ncbi:MAG: protocatechuate 3,4-dioxygenase subunit alpha [Phenylobacterium sp.]|uniref:protocatechuate 3,4-dioxygenase subunit alpha n=1 Tax=Phenylobacterium sp. TaxID=1871053 RepID=UPI001A545883|nr:protocatechuate 3,4-dioxygenase subunit alpha [Phenylobacterium sp.]MBL8555902.1 protocatechuate 3,4-dioxygenase subunit alpha [Phenylobacterium sp.]
MGRARLGQTPWQTVGPFFHYALPQPGGADLVELSEAGARIDLTPADHFLLTPPPRFRPPGEIIEIVGRVVDGAGAPTPDALVEIWQPDGEGVFGELFGRCATSDDGGYAFRTVLPGRTSGPGNALQAAHIDVGVLGRGLLRRLVTRIYFEGEPGLDEDPVLGLVPDERRATLVARRTGPGRYRFDIVLQGAGETVFFDC